MCDDEFVADEATSDGAAKAEPFTGVPNTMLDGVALQCAVAAPVWMRWLDCCKKVRAACDGRAVRRKKMDEGRRFTVQFVELTNAALTYLDFPESVIGFLVHGLRGAQRPYTLCCRHLKQMRSMLRCEIPPFTLWFLDGARFCMTRRGRGQAADDGALGGGGGVYRCTLR